MEVLLTDTLDLVSGRGHSMATPRLNYHTNTVQQLHIPKEAIPIKGRGQFRGYDLHIKAPKSGRKQHFQLQSLNLHLTLASELQIYVRHNQLKISVVVVSRCIRLETNSRKRPHIPCNASSEDNSCQRSAPEYRTLSLLRFKHGMFFTSEWKY